MKLFYAAILVMASTLNVHAQCAPAQRIGGVDVPEACLKNFPGKPQAAVNLCCLQSFKKDACGAISNSLRTQQVTACVEAGSKGRK
jgi:hypothetical protein